MDIFDFKFIAETIACTNFKDNSEKEFIIDNMCILFEERHREKFNREDFILECNKIVFPINSPVMELNFKKNKT